MNNHQETYEATVREIAEIETRLERLHALRGALEGLLGLAPTGDHVMIPNGLIKPQRAPHGALQKAILELFTDGQKLGNAEIRGGLKRAKYPYMIDATSLRKTLSRLAKSGSLSVNYVDDRAWYCRSHKKT